MAEYWTIHSVLGVAGLYEQFLRVIAAAERNDQWLRSHGFQPVNTITIQKLQWAFRDFQRELRSVSTATASRAQAQIITNIRKTQQRPDTLQRPNLRDLIFCRPLGAIGRFEMGAVGVADVGILNSGAVSYKGYPYWEVQEKGSLHLAGKVLRGYFYAGGYSGPPSPPSMARRRQHPVFSPGPPLGGEVPGLAFGLGVIRDNLPARNFIRDGAASSGAQYRADMAAVQMATLTQIASLGAPAVVP